MSSVWDVAEREHPSQSSPAPSPQPISHPATPTRVVVTDFDMPFASMVGFMIKWTLAAIPALIILVFGFMAIAAVLGGLFGVSR